MIKEGVFILEDGHLDYSAIEEVTTVEFVLNFYAEGEYQDYAILNCYFSGREYFSVNKINRYAFEDLGFELTEK